MTIDYAPAALDELRRNMAYYEGKQPGLGNDLLDEVEAVVAGIARSPNSYPEFRRSGRRKARLNRFPHTVYFAPLPNGNIWVAAIRGDGQNDSWLTRQPADPA